MSADTSSTSIPATTLGKPPRLAPLSGSASSGAKPYATWRPSIEAYMLRAGVRSQQYKQSLQDDLTFDALVATVEAVEDDVNSWFLRKSHQQAGPRYSSTYALQNRGGETKPTPAGYTVRRCATPFGMPYIIGEEWHRDDTAAASAREHGRLGMCPATE